MNGANNRRYVAKVFWAVFFAGVASLQMELSVLREATFIFGSTAFTNSFVISIFLAGLAIGSYSGNLLVRLRRGKAAELFLISQGLHIALILFFVFTKSYVLYGQYSKLAGLLYFGFVTVIPSIIGGMSFAFFLNMLYGRGEKHIALVYAISTAGNVFSGLLHGMILVPYFGMPSTYSVAIVNTGLAMLLTVRFHRIRTLSLALLILVTGFLCVSFRFVPREIENAVLWSKDDVYGLVEVVDSSQSWKGWDGRKGVDVRIHNLHNCANSEKDIQWHEDSAILSMQLLADRAKKVLILGYCSGSTVFQLLEYDSITQVISIEMNRAVLEAAEIFFPTLHERISRDSRSLVVVDEFRSYLRNQPEDVKFDIVILDITIKDPYFFGMFTREFFADVYKHLERPGVVFFHYPSLMRTAAEVFEHIYKPTPDALRPEDWYFCTNFVVPEHKKDSFYEVFPKDSPGSVYADHKIYRYPHLPMIDRILLTIKRVLTKPRDLLRDNRGWGS
jgi:predicted membrane-bound spermidine synthase